MTEKSKLSKLLIFVGYCPRVAKALAWLIQHGTGVVTSREIERGADLRQPEVHYAIEILSGSGWIKKIETPSTSKPGRPFIQYQFTLNKEQAFAEIKKIMDAKAGEIAATTAEIQKEIFTEPVQAPAVVQ